MKVTATIRKWTTLNWGIANAPLLKEESNPKRYFVHRANLLDKTQVLGPGVKIQFTVGTPRTANELEPALDIEVVSEGGAL